MVESSRQVQFSDPYERFDEAISDPRLYPAQPYQRPESTQLEPLPHDRVPLFLSDYDQQYEEEQYDDQPHYTFGSKQPKSYTGRIVSGVVAASTAAAIVGLFAMEQQSPHQPAVRLLWGRERADAPRLDVHLGGIGDAATLEPGDDLRVGPDQGLARGVFGRHQRRARIGYEPPGQQGSGRERHDRFIGRVLPRFEHDHECLSRHRVRDHALEVELVLATDLDPALQPMRRRGDGGLWIAAH